MFSESELVEALDRAESQEHDREISELLDRLNEPQEVWIEGSAHCSLYCCLNYTLQLFRGLPFEDGHCLRTVTMTAMTPLLV
ncbi:hypothetical protein J6590_068354 [Homalodisca vitripennis]|nr:hypothetical protein J6590_068354 [Homalodisca vitripennis]